MPYGGLSFNFWITRGWQSLILVEDDDVSTYTKEVDVCSNLWDHGLLIQTQDWAQTHEYSPFKPRLILGLKFYFKSW